MKKILMSGAALAIGTAALFAAAMRAVYRETDRQYLAEHWERNKYRSYFNTLMLWQRLSLEGGQIGDYFSDSESIAVYGMGDIGKLVCRALKKGWKGLALRD